MCVSDSSSPSEQLALQLRRHLFLLFQQLFLTAFPLLSRRTPCLLGCSLTKHGVHTLGVVHMFTPHTKHSVWVEQTWSRQIWLLRAASQALKSGPVKRGDVVVDTCTVKRNVVKTVHRGHFVFRAFLFLRECPIVFIEWERWHRDTSHSCSLCCFFFTGYHTITRHTHKLAHLRPGCFFLTGWFDAGGGAYISVVKFRLGLLYLYLRFVFVFAYLCFSSCETQVVRTDQWLSSDWGPSWSSLLPPLPVRGKLWKELCQELLRVVW